MSASGLYVGAVAHRRLRPKRHHLRYRSFWLLLDLDEMPALARSTRLFSLNRFNLFSVHERDHGDGSGRPLRAYVERLLEEAGFMPDGGPIRLLTMPRLLGYVFNPLSLFFCYRRDGALAAICYEVSNTFGQRHTYILPAGAGRSVAHSAAKAFYVSPFLGMDLSYAFRVKPPGDEVAVGIHCIDEAGPILTAALSAKRRPFTDAALARVFLTHPLHTLKVMAGIHWEALCLWMKGIRLHKRPPPPERPVTASLEISLQTRPS